MAQQTVRTVAESGKSLYPFPSNHEAVKSVIQVNKKTVYIIVVVLVVVIVAAGVGVVLYYHPTTTPAKPVTVVGATSLQFAVNATSSGVTTTLGFAGENIGTSNLMMRIDDPAGNYSIIMNYGQQKSWATFDNGTTWTLDSSFATDNSTWGERWTGEVTALANWNGTGNYVYTTTTSGVTTTVTIYDISVNPSLPASLFATS
jgi:hypothetical protein